MDSVSGALQRGLKPLKLGRGKKVAGVIRALRAGSWTSPRSITARGESEADWV